jgi:hypothetical protein
MGCMSGQTSDRVGWSRYRTDQISGSTQRGGGTVAKLELYGILHGAQLNRDAVDYHNIDVRFSLTMPEQFKLHNKVIELIGKRVWLVIEDDTAEDCRYVDPFASQELSRTIGFIERAKIEECPGTAEPVQEGSGYMSRPKLL